MVFKIKLFLPFILAIGYCKGSGSPTVSDVKGLDCFLCTKAIEGQQEACKNDPECKAKLLKTFYDKCEQLSFTQRLACEELVREFGRNFDAVIKDANLANNLCTDFKYCSKCNETSGFGLVVAKRTESSPLENKHVTKPTTTCTLENGFWQVFTPTSYPIPNDSYKNNQLAFVLDSSINCNDLCACLNGECYVPQAQPVYVEIVPYCSRPNECHIYAAPYENFDFNVDGISTKFYGLVKKSNGQLVSSPNPTTKPVAIDSLYPKINYISCHGCPTE